MFVTIGRDNLLYAGNEGDSRTYFVEGIDETNIQDYYYQPGAHAFIKREPLGYVITTKDDVINVKFECTDGMPFLVTFEHAHGMVQENIFIPAVDNELNVGFRCEVDGKIIVSNTDVRYDFEPFVLESEDCGVDPLPTIKLENGIISVNQSYYRKEIDILKQQIKELKGE